MRVIDIENIVTNMRDDTRFVLRCEEVFHDKISSAAASILMNKRQKPIVCLTGPSGADLIVEDLLAAQNKAGIVPHIRHNVFNIDHTHGMTSPFLQI